MNSCISVRTTVRVGVRAQNTLANANHTDPRPTYKHWADIPQPPSYPIIGNGYLFLKSESTALHKLYAGLKQSYGDVYRTTILGDTFLNIHNPEDVKTLLANDGPKPIIPGFDNFTQIRKMQTKYFGDLPGLISQGDEWYQFRQAVQQDMMRPRSALYYVEDIENIAVEFTDKINDAKDQHGDVDIGRFCQEFALDSISCIFLGGKIGALAGSKDGRDMIEGMGEFMKYAFLIYMSPSHICQWLPFYSKAVKASTATAALISKHIDHAREKIDMEDEGDESVLSKLVRKHGADSKIPVVMAIDAIGAGIDTTGNTAILLLYHLAKYPEKQEKLYQEILSFLGKEGKITSSSLMKMRYLKACQQESQRMLPVTSGIIRQTQVEMILGGYQVPAGTKVLVHSANNCENSFSNPELFLPERWLRGHADQHQAGAYSNLPFSHGPRSCIGQRFARLELYLVMAKMIQRFRIEYHGEDVGIKSGLVGAPDKPVILNIKER